MSLISSAPFSNVTIYRKDFQKKSGFRPPKYQAHQEFANPISGPFEEHVLPNFKYQNLPKSQTKYPDPKEYAEHVAEKYPSTKAILKDAPDLDVIDKLYENENRTVYMVSYCVKGDYDSKMKREKQSNPLPEGWDIPLTTQKCSYRHPRVVAPEGITVTAVPRPKDNLLPNEKEREILKTKTGETIYISDISNTGTDIIEGKLHGDVNVRPQFDQDDLLKAMLIRRE